MAILFTSDTHFGHTNIIKYCDRPYADVEEMNQAMIDRWNEVVTFKDTVYHLGDFAFGPVCFVEKCRKKLNGKVILIHGNHDRIGKETLSKIFTECYSKTRIKLGEQTLHLSHHPIQTEDGSADYYLNGHVHTRWITEGRRVNVGVDVWNFKPVTWGEIKAKLMI